MMSLPNGCSDVLSVRTESIGGGNRGPEFTGAVTVIVQDTMLARRSYGAYSAYLANSDEARRKEDLEKAKNQKAPAF